MNGNERRIYEIICSHNGIKAKDIGKKTGLPRNVINRYLYGFPYIKELCYQDSEYKWHGMISQNMPHKGLENFSGYYGLVSDFLSITKDEWFERLKQGCKDIGRNLNDTRGLFHSFLDCYDTMIALFDDLKEYVEYDSWEIVFELRIKKSRCLRIYADVLVIAPSYVFSLEFKMKDAIEGDDVAQAAKYNEYLEVLFGSKYEIISGLVLTGATDLYKYIPMENSSAELPVCSGDMLFNIFIEYLPIVFP
ncbi:MAG: winged helix-turn-helix domain-containing protein [Lachnospiraceae bacterium]|nr:winged helix-turn-helix domain-containing protein [Lachnospiraceae bacterium]